MNVLPENILKCMTPEQRQELGQKSAAEVLEHGEATSEKTLQKQIVGLLRLKGIEVNVSRMDKRKTDRVGWPDLTFTIYAIAPQRSLSSAWPHAWQTFSCLWEVKMPQGKLTPQQEALHDKLRRAPNGWQISIIRSVDQAIAELKEMGIE